VQRWHELGDGPWTSKAVGHPKSEIAKSAFYQNLVNRREVQIFFVNAGSAQQFLVAHIYTVSFIIEHSYA